MSKQFRGGRDAKRCWMPEPVDEDDDEDAAEAMDWQDDWMMRSAPEQQDETNNNYRS